MNAPPSSSSKSKRPHHSDSLSSKLEPKTKKNLSSGNPLQDHNTTIVTPNNSSFEAPRGCLRFCLSNFSSSNSNAKTPFIDRPIKIKTLGETTPKSAPNPSKPSKRSVSRKAVLQNEEKVRKNPPSLYQWQSGRKTNSGTGSKSKISSVLDTSGSLVNKVSSGSELRVCSAVDVNLTPLSKVATGLRLKFREDEKENVVYDYEKLSNPSGNKNKTPPIQVSVSPEIQTPFASSIVATETRPACYSAGYVLSGVTDKRKCRPRGILTVGENNVLDFGAAKDISGFDEDDDRNKENVLGVVDKSSSVSVLPLPAEALMHWILSPRNEEDEDYKENSEIGLCRYQIHSPNSDLFNEEFNFSDLCNGSNSRSSASVTTRKRCTSSCSPGEGILWPFHDNEAVSCTPRCTPSFMCAGSEEERKCCGDFDRENSPFSMDVLGSGNVIQTPDSSPDRCVGLSRLTEVGKEHPIDSELDLITENLQRTSLSSKGYESIWDPTSSSFQFDCLTTASNSVDLSNFSNILDDQSSWISTSTLGNVSQSHTRISWREGLVTRIFDMDEFDSCRYLSDGEDNASGYHNNQLKSCQNPEISVDVGEYEILKNGLVSAEFVDTGLKNREKSEERLPSQLSCSCAESISADGGSLTASGDSDWTLYYTNHLFKV
ncbi:uncharacterized protein LOC123221360 [Mangifera indica]|uniref:uncharacterized protein LOC123221360 n=1 Tax=Mangifera indica TaxID=29780 RepID=UPI001CFC2F51|nr:uncharacterized protein LOC123221360 [Mangifera indica]